MSLLDDVSIVVTPNGYKAGELYAVVPVPTEGAEEITNGDFATDLSGWSTSGTNGTNTITWETNGARIISTGANIGLFQNTLIIGKTYRLTCDVSITVGKIGLDGATSGSTVNMVEGFNEIIFTAISTTFKIKRITGNDNCLLDNVSVKEYTAADMDVTRATAATRVDEAGLVNYAEILGSEEVENGGFDSGSNWSTPSGWEIIDGKLEGTNVNAVSATQGGYVFVNKTFEVTYTLSGYVQGEVRVYLGGSQPTANKSANGTYTETISISASANTTLYIHGISTFTGNIDNISVKEVTRDNVPRIDYTGGGCPHILAEPQRTNLIPYSEDFTQWTKANASLINTITSTVLSPDGVSYANKLYPIGSSTGSYIRQTIAGDCFSIFVKKGERRWVLIYGGFGNSNVWFDSENGVFGNVLSEATATVESFGNDWYRIEILWTQNSAHVRIYNTDSGTSTQSTGNGTDGIYIWGAQVEQGSYATSYIPNFGTALGVTRNQDQFTRDGIGSLINSTEGVLFAELSALANDGLSKRITLADGSISNRVSLELDETANKIKAFISRGGASQILEYTAPNLLQFNKIGIKWKENDFALWFNGNEVATDSSGNVPIGLTELVFEGGNSFSTFFGKVKQLQVYKTALTDEQLIQLTGTSGTDFYESYAEMASALTYTIQ